jgi:protein SCO1/2
MPRRPTLLPLRLLAPVLWALALAWLPANALAAAAGLTPHLGSALDARLLLTDGDGRQASLGDLTAGQPSLLLLGYHRCPNLCGIAQLGLAQALAATGLREDSYRVLFVSIDPDETATDAAASREKLRQAGAAGLAGWRFLVGGAPAIARLEDAVGLAATRPPNSDVYIHPLAIAVLTPDLRLSRVLPGLDPGERNLRLALVEASEGRLGTLGEHILLLCSGFDAATGRYDDVVMVGLRAAAVTAMLGLGVLIVLLGRGRRAAS